MSRLVINIFWVLLIIILDQASKMVASQYGLVTINQGISFNLLANFFHATFLAHLIFLILILLFWWQKRISNWLGVIIFASGFSNFLDRIFYEGVRDFIQVPYLNISNNLADWFVFVAMMIWLYDLMVKSDQK